MTLATPSPPALLISSQLVMQTRQRLNIAPISQISKWINALKNPSMTTKFSPSCGRASFAPKLSNAMTLGRQTGISQHLFSEAIGRLAANHPTTNASPTTIQAEIHLARKTALRLTRMSSNCWEASRKSYNSCNIIGIHFLTNLTNSITSRSG